jgi:hypothetical protein
MARYNSRDSAVNSPPIIRRGALESFGRTTL